MKKKTRLVVPLALLLLVGACASSTSAPPPARPVPAPAVTPVPAPTPPTEGVAPGVPPIPVPTVPVASRGPVGDYREVMKLYRANLSEDFILERIRRDGAIYDLTADQIITLRSSGVSERVIQAMLDTRNNTGAYTAYDTAAPAPAPPPMPRRPPEDRITISADAPVVWEGLVRRNPGIVILKNRWHVGTLTFADGQFRWVDARDSTRNVLVPWNAVAEQFMSCLKKAGGNECFEWGFRTRNGDEYRFRDVSWEQGDDQRVQTIHAYFRSRFPSLVDSERPVDEK